jgi:hypothetical protein
MLLAASRMLMLLTHCQEEHPDFRSSAQRVMPELPHI